MGPLSDGPGNVLALMVPLAKGADGYLMSYIAEADEAGDVKNVTEYCPPDWEAKFKTHLWPIETFVTDLEGMPGVFGINVDARAKYAEEGVTHLACLESEVVGPTEGSFFFGDKEVKHVSMLLTYCAERDSYRLVHCIGCLQTYLAYIAEMQPRWNPDADGGEPKTKGPTLN